MAPSHKIEDVESTYRKQVVALQWITVAWMCLEAAVAIFAAVRAHSVVLLGFGVDSAIELASAFIVFLRFRTRSPLSEARAGKVTGLLLFALAVCIFASSILALTNPDFQPKPSYVGIALLMAAAPTMPWLARKKRGLAAKTGSGSLKADATQSAMCGYLAWISLAGLVANATFKMVWADPVAALLLMPIVGREGWEAWQGKPCRDCSC
jgi:divalent metal cation (Fe/Co/Zn/Cd) transporter